MKSHLHPTQLRRHSRLCPVAGSLFAALVFQAHANVDINLKLWHGYNFYYGDVSMVATNPTPVTYHRVQSPGGLIWQNAGINNTGSSACLSLTNDLDALVDECTNGMWSLFFNRGTGSEAQYYFTVTVSSLGTNDLPAVDITMPADGSSGVSASTDYAWMGPTNFSSTFVSVFRCVPRRSIAKCTERCRVRQSG